MDRNIYDPIVMGAIIGGIGGGFFLPLPESLNQNNIHKIVIGATGGGIGGWMASQVFTNPSGIYIMVGSLVGVVVLANFLGLV